MIHPIIKVKNEQLERTFFFPFLPFPIFIYSLLCATLFMCTTCDLNFLDFLYSWALSNITHRLYWWKICDFNFDQSLQDKGSLPSIFFYYFMFIFRKRSTQTGVFSAAVLLEFVCTAVIEENHLRANRRRQHWGLL